MVPCSSGTRPPCRSAGRPWPAARPGRPCGQRVAAQLLRRWRGRWRARAPRARPACPACCGRPPCPDPPRALQRLLAVLVEEELGVGQARAHHALVAADDRAGVVGADVADDQERLRQLALAASSSGKYFWLAFIVRIRHSCGTSRNSLFELAHQHVRPLDQGRHLVQQRIVFNRSCRAWPTRRCGRQLAIRFRRGARQSWRSPRRLAQRGGVVIGVRDRPPARLGGSKRWPCVLLPAFRPSASTGTTVLPCNATRPCAGRTKLTLLQPGSAQPVSSW
jgi:hypothetical protein